MRRSLTILPAAFAVAAILVSSVALEGPAPATATQAAYVSAVFNRFAPEDLVVAAGTTVTWVNEDYNSGEWHDVIAEDGSFISESFAPGGAFSVVFWNPGTYVYYCDLHEGMYGRIFVQ